MEQEMDFCEEFRRKKDGHMFIRYNRDGVLYSMIDHSGWSDLYHVSEDQLADEFEKIKEYEEEA